VVLWVFCSWAGVVAMWDAGRAGVVPGGPFLSGPWGAVCRLLGPGVVWRVITRLSCGARGVLGGG
jgi:hypothetical protein